ncbi:non-structural maintenance of chromosomes element 3 homolog [Octopus bimaculoides]|uniref:MAGE domain-containing protein n=1 Tax=Octopus bimaculoides TaxID=37653 RepID=A0A0L8GMZ3_OCTBM|nr:non-structural maintenance of chromosomes element 3 homolog [Octopus bimaculoides]|eukprot:XP_014779807.1 PREDICTED: melanoma-associated antigen G1-like [Octopus bimaculoides]
MPKVTANSQKSAPMPSCSSKSKTPTVSQVHEQNSTQNDLTTESEDLERKAIELVQYLLIADQKKIPVRKIDINNHILKDQKKYFPAILKKSRDMLQSVFGAKLIEFDDKLKKRYILITSRSDIRRNINLISSEEESAKLGLLFNILAIIYMNGGVISDSDLWKALRKLGVDPDVHHEVFGDVKKLLTEEFVRQYYLEYVRQSNSEPIQYEFHWGFRAEKELQKKDVLLYVSKIYKTEPSQWKLLWNNCMEEEANQSSTS